MCCCCRCSRQRLSSGGSMSRMSQLQSRFTAGRAGQAQQETYIVSPYQNQLTSLAVAAAAAASGSPDIPMTAIRPATVVLPPPTRPVEPTHFHWNTSSRRKRPANQQPSDATTASDFKPRLNCTVSSLLIGLSQVAQSPASIFSQEMCQRAAIPYE